MYNINMQIKNINTIYFSPTGNTEKCVKALSSAFKHNNSYDLMEKDYEEAYFDENDVCFFAFPTFGGRIPPFATHRLNHFHGNNTKAILLITYGNRAYEDAFYELYDVIKEHNFNIIGGVIFPCEHSIINEFARNRPNNQDINDLEKLSYFFLDNINSLKQININSPHQYKEYKIMPLKFKINDTCIKCYRCVKMCPVNAISKTFETDNKKCISCNRCVHVCLNHSREIDNELRTHLKEKINDVCKVRKEYQLIVNK